MTDAPQTTEQNAAARAKAAGVKISQHYAFEHGRMGYSPTGHAGLPRHLHFKSFATEHEAAVAALEAINAE